MDSNLRFHQKALCSLLLCLTFFAPLLTAVDAKAESEAYRRQVKFETDRAADFRRFIRYLEQIDRERTSAIPGYKSTIASQEAFYLQAQKAYSEMRKREERMKPTEEFIERMLASEAAKEEQEKEAIRKEYVRIQKEIERAIANTRLNEAEEYQLDR